LEKSVAYNVGEGRTYINLNGKERHIVGYLKGFLFTPKRSAMPVKALSGGERNRVILAKLFTRAANLLILDEPTNDLDIETLEVLEKRLRDYSGTLIVVSHDREFLDNVVTSTVVFEEDGQAREYVGGYSDWVRQGHQLAETENIAVAEARKHAVNNRRKTASKTKLSYKEQRELDQLPGKIELLESNVSTLQSKIASPDFYSNDSEHVQMTLSKLGEIEGLLEQRVERWGELQSRQDSLQSH
jgi:ATP-binding cassette subfamily F protein uup